MSSIPLWLTAVQRATEHPKNTLYLSGDTVYAGFIKPIMRNGKEQEAVDSIIRIYSKSREPIPDEIREKMRSLSSLISNEHSNRPLVQLFNFFVPSTQQKLQETQTPTFTRIADDFKYNALTHSYVRHLQGNEERLGYGNGRKEEIDLVHNTYKLVYGEYFNSVTVPIEKAPKDIPEIAALLRQKASRSPSSG